MSLFVAVHCVEHHCVHYIVSSEHANSTAGAVGIVYIGFISRAPGRTGLPPGALGNIWTTVSTVIAMSTFEAVCCACPTDFRSHRRLVRHLRRTNTCNEVYYYLDAHRQIPLLERQVLDALGEQSDQARTHVPEAHGQLAIGQPCSDRLQLRAIKIPGPLLSEADAVGMRR